MWHVIKWTIWQRRWAIIWWCLGILAFVSLELGVYPSIRSQAAQLNQTLQNLPDSVRSLFGFTEDPFSPVGYLNSRLYYLLLPLMLSILAIGLGSSLIAREEGDGTLELLLSRPISRGRLLLAKAFAGFMVVTFVSLITIGGIVILTKLVDIDIALANVAFAALLAALLALLFGMVAFAVSALGRLGRGASMGVAALVALGSYIITSFEDQVHWLSWPAKALPYHYYNPPQILHGSLTWTVAAAYVVVIFTLGACAWAAFRRRDIGGNG